jgi:hypothetical protein
MRNESYRSSRLDNGARARHVSSKQRQLTTSKTSVFDITYGEIFINGLQDENIYYNQQPTLGSQHLNGASFDLSNNRKPLTTNRSNTINVPSYEQHTHVARSALQDRHRQETTVDQRDARSKGQTGSVSRHRQLSTTQAVGTSTTLDRQSPVTSHRSRDPNDSYAYTDVKKYIEENDLMPSHKERFIHDWIMDVEKYRDQLRKVDC